MNTLETFAALSGKLFMGGSYQTSQASEHFDVIEPASEQQIGQIADATDAEVDAATDVAIGAGRAWNAIDMRSRAVVMHEIAAVMRRDKALYAEYLTREEGKPFKESLDEVSWCATAMDYYAEIARHEAGRIAGATVPGQFHFAIKEPLGTVVIILPFNYPLVLLCWEAAAALAAGNAVIVKPHEQTSITTLKFMEVFKGLPEGLMQCLTGGSRVAQRLVASRKTHGVAYTGSVAVGQAVARTCAESFKPCLIEASGNDPFIVMPSAPLDIAARGAAFAAYLNCGQVCLAVKRAYVHESIYEAMCDELARLAQEAVVDDGLKQGTNIGPIQNRAQFEKVKGFLEAARRVLLTLEQAQTKARAVAAGAFVAIAHPQWSGLTLEDARSISAAHAVEIYNHGCAMGCDRPDGAAIADLLLTEGRRLTLIATDDAHFSEPDHFGGWVMVKAEANEPEALLAALKAGHFYSTQGPELRDVRVEGGKLIVTSSAVVSVVALGHGTGAKAVHGHSMTHTEVPLDRVNNSPWVRAAVIDAAGKRAWSNPIWTGEHGRNPRVAG